MNRMIRKIKQLPHMVKASVVVGLELGIAFACASSSPILVLTYFTVAVALFALNENFH